jgi:hypothetical protein
MIKINNTDIRIRPSAVDSFFGCGYQWGLNFLEGRQGRSNSRAGIGTAIHSAAEVFWTDAIAKNKKDANLGMMTDAAMESFEEELKKDMKFGDGENPGTCRAEIIKGTEAFIEDITPFAQIPTKVEEFFEVPIQHPLVSGIGGTIDYLTPTMVGDLKTGKRKPGMSGFVTQQSIYKLLAQENGYDIKYNVIQSVVLKKVPDGAIYSLDANIPMAKYLVNTILDTLDLVLKDVVPIETILRGNPKHTFCSPRWCDHYDTCPFVQGKVEVQPAATKIEL